jgi:2-succinyl-6-hydroxy-2,4-cyclohexadiene-1-carboxylate synthase
LNHQVIGDPQLPHLVFLHGFLGRGADFIPITKALLPHFCSILIDLPGHGGSLLESAADYGMAATAQSVIQVLEIVKSEHQTILYGYSMGGRLGLYLALEYPEYFNRVILESTSAGLATESEKQSRIKSDKYWIQRLELNPSMPEFLTEWYAQPILKTLKQQPNFAELLQKRSHNQPEYLVKSLREMGLGQQPYLGDRLHHLSIPLKFLAGEFDSKFIALQTELAARSPQASLTIIPHAGHNAHWENPAAVIRKIANFAIGDAAYNA